MAKNPTVPPPEEQPEAPPPDATPDIDEEALKALGMPVRIQTEQEDQPLVLTSGGVRGSRSPAEPAPEQAAQAAVDTAAADARAAAAQQQLSDVPAEGQVRVVYQGDSYTLEIGEHRFHPGQPQDVSREVAAQVLALPPDHPFVVVSTPAEGATEEAAPSTEAEPQAQPETPVASAEEGPNA